MKIVALIGKVLLGSVAVLLLAGTAVFGWYRFGDWEARAVEDLERMHETILRHHPGAVDPENPEFAVLMDQALARAMPMAQSSRSPADHHAALDAYTDTFRDGHLTVAYPEDALGMLSRMSANRAGMSETSGIDITDNEAWITISSFNEANSRIASLTGDIEAQADVLRSLDRIVFDLRGNSGGSSAFGDRIARALWTEEVFLDWVPVSATAVEWRATAENATHVRRIAQRNEDGGRTASAESWRRLADRLDAAASAGEDYVRVTLATREVTRTRESPVSADVVVITDRGCASACLDFMDRLMALPGVLHVGEETSSDTQYIDIRPVDLPSRTAWLILPLKVWRDRARPPGGTYVPDVPVDAETLDPASLRAAVEAVALPRSVDPGVR